MLPIYELMTVGICLVLSGFFSGSEAVLLSISIDRAKQLIKEGGTRASALNFMISRPNQMLTTILVGNNIVNMLFAAVVTSLTAQVFSSDVIGISAGISTLLVLIFGEITPKSFARSHAEKLVVFTIRALQVCYVLLYPIVALTTYFIESMLGKNSQLKGRVITKDDIEYMMSRAEREKSMDSKQIDLINSVLEFPTIKVKDIMVPRFRVRYIQEKASYEDIISFIRKDAHSRYPVCKGELEHAIGFLHVKDLAFVRSKDKSNFDVKKYLKPPFFVYEHMKIQAVFDHMKRKKVHLAVVKDENGVVVGIVTLEDIIEEIFGEIHDEHDDEILEQGELPANSENGILVDSSILLRDLNDAYELDLPLNENFSTLGGLMLGMLGNRFPQEGQIIIWEGYSFELEDVNENEIKEIRITNVSGDKHLFRREEHLGE